MKISFNSYFLRKITGLDYEKIIIDENYTLKKMIDHLINKYGIEMEKILIDKKNNKIKILFLINGVLVSDFNYRISENDIVDIFPMTAGG